MRKVMSILLVVVIVAMAGTAIASEYYKIKKDIRILAFVGKPTSLNVIPVLYHTAVNQYINLYHKDSGPGVYAFYLQGLIIKDSNGDPIRIKKKGFFVIKKRLLVIIKQK